MRLAILCGVVLTCTIALADESFEPEWCNSNVRMYLPDESAAKTGEVCFGDAIYDGDIAVNALKIVEDGETTLLYEDGPWTRISSTTIRRKFLNIQNQNSEPIDVFVTGYTDKPGTKEVSSITPKGFLFLATAPSK
jgi:hypothetical protein